MILLATKGDPVLPDTDDGGDDADRKAAAFERAALLDMRLEVSNVPPAFGHCAWAACKTHVAQRLAHGFSTGAVACGVDIGLGDAADIRSAAKETSEMSFLVAPCRNFNGAVCAQIEIDHAGGLEGIDDAKRPIEPAGVVLAFEMRARQ